MYHLPEAQTTAPAKTKRSADKMSNQVPLTVETETATKNLVQLNAENTEDELLSPSQRRRLNSPRKKTGHDVVRPKDPNRTITHERMEIDLTSDSGSEQPKRRTEQLPSIRSFKDAAHTDFRDDSSVFSPPPQTPHKGTVPDHVPKKPITFKTEPGTIDASPSRSVKIEPTMLVPNQHADLFTDSPLLNQALSQPQQPVSTVSSAFSDVSSPATYQDVQTPNPGSVPNVTATNLHIPIVSSIPAWHSAINMTSQPVPWMGSDRHGFDYTTPICIAGQAAEYQTPEIFASRGQNFDLRADPYQSRKRTFKPITDLSTKLDDRLRQWYSSVPVSIGSALMADSSGFVPSGVSANPPRATPDFNGYYPTDTDELMVNQAEVMRSYLTQDK